MQVKAISLYSIWLKFDDNTEGVVDLSHLINKPVFQNWKESEYFKKVYIDSESGAIAWDENIELCPDNMYLKIKGLTFEQWNKSQFSSYATSK